MPARDDVAVGIVVFRPDARLLVPLVQGVARQAGPVFVLANSAIDREVRAAIEAEAELIVAPANLGVAEGFNICALAAMLRGKRRILLLDQDSTIDIGLIDALSLAMDTLAAAGKRPAVAGPRIVAPNASYKAPRYFPAPGAHVGESAPVRYVISSGSLVDLGAFRVVGAFRSDFFIDGIDTEWCFRAWARGWSCWVHEGATMTHRIGGGVMKTRLGASIPQQADFRLHAYVRNQAYCLTLPHVPFAWKLRFGAHTARVALVSWIDRRFSPRFLGRMIGAAVDGLASRLGPPPGAQDAHGLEFRRKGRADRS